MSPDLEYEQVVSMKLAATATVGGTTFYWDPFRELIVVRCPACGHERALDYDDVVPNKGWRHGEGCACVVCAPPPPSTVIDMGTWLAAHGRKR